MVFKKMKKIINTSSRFFHVDMSYILSGTSFLGVSHVVQVVSSLFLVYIFANLVPKEVFGTYKYALSIIGILGIFTLNDIGSALVRAVSQGHEKTFFVGVRTQLKWNIIVTLLSAIAAIYYYFQGNATLAVAILIGGSFFPILTSSRLYESLLVGRKDFRRKFLYSIPKHLIPIVSISITVLLTHSVPLIILVYFVSHSAINAYLFFRTLRAVVPSGDVDPKAMSYSKHLSLLNILGAFGARLDNIIVFHHLGSVALASYAIAKILPDQLRVSKSILQSIALPKISNRDFNKIVPTLSRRYVILFVFFSILVLFYILTVPFLFQLIFPEYLDMIPYSQALSLTLLGGPAFLYMQTLIAHAKKKELYIVKTIIPIIRICSYIVLIPLYGLWGIVIGAILTVVSQNILLIILTYRSFRLSKSP